MNAWFAAENTHTKEDENDKGCPCRRPRLVLCACFQRRPFLYSFSLSCIARVLYALRNDRFAVTRACTAVKHANNENNQLLCSEAAQQLHYLVLLSSNYHSIELFCDSLHLQYTLVHLFIHLCKHEYVCINTCVVVPVSWHWNQVVVVLTHPYDVSSMLNAFNSEHSISGIYVSTIFSCYNT